MIWPTNHCYDCLVPIPMDDLLCPKCQAVYRRRKVQLIDGGGS